VINLNLGTATRWGLHGLLLLSLSLAFYQGRTIFIPTIIALLLAAMLWPAVQWLNQQGVPLPGLAARRRFPWLAPCVWRLRVPWSIACTAAIAILVVVALGVTLAFAATIPKLLQALPNTDEKAQVYYERLHKRLEQISPWPLDPYYLPEKAEESQLVKYVRNALDPKNPFVVDALKGVAFYGGNWLWQAILIMFILLFLLLEGRMLTRRLVEVLGPGAEVQGKAIAALEDIATQVRTYLVWRTIVNFAMALTLGLVYYIVGLSQAWTWALITAILLYVPYLGPILAGIPPVLDALVTCESPLVAVGLLVFYVAFITVEGYFIVPVVMGRGMDLNATTVMLSCLYWELVWGPAGLFLAMPMMAAAKTICTHVPDWRPWANLMDTRDEPAEPLVEEVVHELLDEAPTQVIPPAEKETARTEKVDQRSFGG
jgi:predicted PurR-regulated permease PerM